MYGTHTPTYYILVQEIQWAIPLFNYTPLQMTINGVQGGIGNMSRGWSFKCLSRGVRGHNRSLSRGEGSNIEACPGGWNKTEACPGGIYKSVPGRWRYNISLSRGAFIYCPGGVCLQLLSSVGVYG